MQRVEIKNRSTTSSIAISLTTLESAILNIILRVFIKDLIDYDIRKEATREMVSTNRSLSIIYNLAEEARRINVKI